ncbi:MAG: PAS domain-containing protein [Alphaproteobacteria bacterium]|jgi:PAS domain-containing protein
MENDHRMAHPGLYEKIEQRFSDLAEVLSDWFWETDKNLRFIYLSERVFMATGVKPEFFYKKTRQELTVIDENREGWRRHFRDLEDRKPFRNFTYRRLGPKEDVQWISTRGVPYFDKTG